MSKIPKSNSGEDVSYEEFSRMLIDLVNWIGRAEAANQMALMKIHEIMRVAHLLKNKK